MNKWALSLYSLQASIAELASTAATDVGMHGLLASQSCYHSVLPRGVSSMVLFMLKHPPANEQKLCCVRRCPVLVCLSLVFLLSTAI